MIIELGGICKGNCTNSHHFYENAMWVEMRGVWSALYQYADNQQFNKPYFNKNSNIYAEIAPFISIVSGGRGLEDMYPYNVDLH